jgi:catechol 2,3-dioxygenase-like lactoylglutathione lyase family enzyme
MKRLHVHVSVKDLPASLRFYRTLFGADPAVTQPDYAKWMLEDPRVNFAISVRRIGHPGCRAHRGLLRLPAQRAPAASSAAK